MDKERVRFEIKRKKFMLFLTERVIRKDMLDDLSKTMIAQAQRIQAEIEALELTIKGKKVNKNNNLKTKRKKRVSK